MFSASREWRHAVGGAARGYQAIHGLARRRRQSSLRARRHRASASRWWTSFTARVCEFSFSAYRAPRIEPSREATLSIPLGGYDLALHDAERKEVAIYQFLQSPQRVGGVEVRGDPARVRVKWRKSPERFVTGYRVYAAAERAGPYDRVLETKDIEAALAVDPAKRYSYYRVSAFTRLEVEGETSAPAEDLFRAGYREFEAGRYRGGGSRHWSAPRRPHPTMRRRVEYLGRSLLALGRNDAAIGAVPGPRRAVPAMRSPGGGSRRRRSPPAATRWARARWSSAQSRPTRPTPRPMCCAGSSACSWATPRARSRCLETALARGVRQSGCARHARRGASCAWARWTRASRSLTRPTLIPRETRPLAARRAGVPVAWPPRDALARYTRVARDRAATTPSRWSRLRTCTSLWGSSIRRAPSRCRWPEARPQESRGQYVLGRIAIKQDKHEDAVVAFARATKLNPKYGAAWASLADAYLGLKDERKARERLRQAAALPDATPMCSASSRNSRAETVARRSARRAGARGRARAGGCRACASRRRAPTRLWGAGRTPPMRRARPTLAPKNVDPLLLGAEAAHRQGKNGEAIADSQARARAPAGFVRGELQARPQLRRHQPVCRRADASRRAGAPERKADAPYLLLAEIHLNQRSYDAAIASSRRP